jgi:hypothetical protein
MESSGCVRDRFLTRGSREAVSTSLNRLGDFPDMPAYPSSLVRRLRFEVTGKVGRTRKLDFLARACL